MLLSRQLLLPHASIAGLGFLLGGCSALTDMSDLTFAQATSANAATAGGSSATSSSQGNGGAGGGCTPAHAGGAAKRVFVTSVAYQGDLASLAGADPFEAAAAECTSLAHRACLEGEWKAWLSAGGKQPSADFSTDIEPYENMAGIPIAASPFDLYGGVDLTAPIDRDEHNLPVAGTHVWTGTSNYGANLAPHCDAGGEWQSNMETAGGIAGQIGETSSQWTDSGTLPCNLALHLYCFEQ
jgi:hypothetical protein